MEAHKQNAENILQNILDPAKLDDQAFLMYAQAEATLALVEQQRIANLIALETHARAWGDVDETTSIFTLDEKANLVYRPEIKKALEIN